MNSAITIGVVPAENSNTGGGSTGNRLFEVISVAGQQVYTFDEGTIIQAVFFNKAPCLPSDNSYTIVNNVLTFTDPNPMSEGNSIAIISSSSTP